MTLPLPGPGSPPPPTPGPPSPGAPPRLLDLLHGDTIAAREAFDRLKRRRHDPEPVPPRPRPTPGISP